MGNILSIIWPLAVVCIALFIVCKFYTFIIDKITSCAKKLLGFSKKPKQDWHSINEFEKQEDSNEDRDIEKD